MERLVRQIDSLTKRLDQLEAQEGRLIYATWTPTVTQGGSVSYSGGTARYARLGPLAIVGANSGATTAGSAGSDIIVGGLPATPKSAPAIVGTFRIQNKGGGTHYIGAAVVVLGSLKFQVSDTIAYVGTNPSYGMASGDIIDFTVGFEV